MKRIWIAAFFLIPVLGSTETLEAQPVLNRVEQFLRDQVDAAKSATKPDAQEPGYLGVIADDRQEQGRGVRVVQVVAKGPADQAGLKAGDLITAIDGENVRNMDDMARAMEGKPVGAKLSFAVTRDGKEQPQVVVLGRRGPTGPIQQPADDLPAPATAPTPPSGPRIGVRTLPVNERAQRDNGLPDARGAMVASVVEGSPAAQAGVPLGAVIMAVDDQPINSPQDLAEAMRRTRAAEIELMYIERGQQIRKKVAVTRTAAEAPRLELRGRPSAPQPQPSVGPVLDTPAAAPPADARSAALEARIKELELRIEKLEAAAARDPK